MTTQQTVNFSSYSNKDLKSSLSSIDRDKFEHNYQACLVEIEKRKTDGTWDTNEVTAERESILKARKWARIFALVQAVGGVLGIGSMISVYGPHLFGGVHWLTAVLFVIAIIVFGIMTWVGWKYWKTGNDTGAWRILLYLQVPGFQISSFSYQFYSGLQLPVGFLQGQFNVSVDINSNLILNWNPQNTGSSFVINLAPIIALVLLNMAQRQKPKDNIESALK